MLIMQQLDKPWANSKGISLHTCNSDGVSTFTICLVLFIAYILDEGDSRLTEPIKQLLVVSTRADIMMQKEKWNLLPQYCKVYGPVILNNGHYITAIAVDINQHLERLATFFVRQPTSEEVHAGSAGV